MTKRTNLLLGFSSFGIWAVFYQPEIIEAALALSFFVIVPIVLSTAVVSLPNWTGRYSVVFGWCGTLSMNMEARFLPLLLAGIWFFFTLILGWSGLRRLLARGIAPLEETAIDIGYLYLPVGGSWFVLAQGGAASLLPYSSVIVDLTAVHFHYAAFLLPVFTGLLGRWHYYNEGSNSMGGYQILTVGVLIGPLLTAAAVDQGPPLEAVLVGIYVFFLYWLAGWTIKAGLSMPPLAKGSLLLSSAVLIITMTLSILYSAGRAAGISFIGISGMIPWHGAWNAFIFSIFALIGWYAAFPAPRAVYNQFPISRLRGRRNIAERFTAKHLPEPGEGLLTVWQNYKREDFSPETLDRLVAAFYTQTARFGMEADITWDVPFLSPVSSFFTNKMKQINIPSSGPAAMSGTIYRLPEERDGRPEPHVWIRQNRSTEEPIFTAVYSRHTKKGVTYFNIALPLPAGVMTGILRPVHGRKGTLILTSRKSLDKRGDEGIYITIGGWTWKTPLQEVFHVWEAGGGLEASHSLMVGPLRFLTIKYRLPLIGEPKHAGVERFSGE
ncbi:YndJ family protein [Salibacterium aidingense]|uniref:YndJ family protein n=1 Tax=Salibacterium aidingense TaxID=384933 RepID=UPI00040D8346|nr:YndJ family protein [Salibacterium aidingense]